MYRHTLFQTFVVRKLPAVLRVAHFSRALDLMNHALSGRKLPGLQENMAYFTTTERRSVDSIQSSLSSAVSCCLAFMCAVFHFSCRKEAELAAAMEKRRVSLIIRN